MNSDIFDLLERDMNEEETQDKGFCSNFNCSKVPANDIAEHKVPERMKSKEVAIRHKRKIAAQLLLQKWNSLRNLSILRHQLAPLLIMILDKELDDIYKHNNNPRNAWSQVDKVDQVLTA